MTPEELKAHEELLIKIKSEVTETMKASGMTAELIEEKLKKLDNSETVEKLKTELTALQENITALENKGEMKHKSLANAIEEAIKLKKEDIEAAARGAGLAKIFKTKADVTPDMTTSQVTTTTGGNALLDFNRADEQGAVRLRIPKIYEYISVMQSDESQYSYTDVIPVHDDSTFGYAAVAAEGTAKKKVAFKTEVRVAAEAVIAAYEHLTKQAWRNVKGMTTLAAQYLLQRVLLKRASQIIDVVKAGATVYDSTTWVADKITNPNLKDCVLAASNQIANSESWADDIQYMPQVAFCNFSDYMGMSAEKDTTEQYLVFDQGENSFKIPIIPMHKNDIPAGYLLVGDFSLVKAFETFAYEVSTGWINDDFIKNQFCLLGETGLITFIKEYDKRAFVYDKLTNIKNGIKVTS